MFGLNRRGFRSVSFTLILFMLSMIVGTLPISVHAAALCVSKSPGNGCLPSIERALAAAHAGDTITVDANTYTENPLTITKNVTLSGAGAGQTIVDVQGKGRTFTVADNLSALTTISNMTITGGAISGTTFNGDAGGGGGVFVGYQSNVALTNVTLTGNKETGGVGGGGVFNFAGTLVLTGCIIDGNQATKGGGIASNGKVTATNTTISNNTVADPTPGGLPDGGGIFNFAPGQSLALDTVTIGPGNSARHGGGIANITNSLATITNSTIKNNTSSDVGAGIYNDADDNGTLPTKITIQNSTISGNQTQGTASGGGIFNMSVLDISATTISGNTATNSGGGVLSAGVLTLSNSTINGNTAMGNPGGGLDFQTGTGTITASTISGNTSPGPGGGILVANGGRLQMTNSTVSGNSLTNKPGNFLVGGGFFVTGGGTLTLNYATVANNTAAGAGGIYNQSGTVNLLGTLLSNNGGGNCGNAVTSQGFNVASDGSCSNVPPGNVNIGPLAGNGGPTQTHALLAGSAAIDQGGSSANGCPATDQTGTSRPQGSACDIGAFELKGGAPPPVVSPATQTVILGNPVRSLDTRASAQSGQGACTTPGHSLSTGASFDLKVTGTCTGVPDNAIGVKGNVTVVAGGAPGFVTLYPTGQPLPVASNANFTPGAVAPNSFTVGIGSGGNITIYASAPTDVIIDIVSYYLPMSGTSTAKTAAKPKAGATSLPLYFHPLAAPVRLFDSRGGQNGCIHTSTPLAGDASQKIVAASACTGIPGGALAIEGNGTVVADAGGGPGFITFYPGGAALPLASNLNYVPGQVAPNNFSVGLGGGDGSFNAYALTRTDLVIDVTGYYDTNSSGGLLFHALAAPVRLLDSRPGQNACSRPSAPLPAGSALPLAPATSSNCTGIPAGAAAIVGNGTVVADAGGGAGYVTFYPGDKSLPLASNLNYVPSQVVPNAFVVGLGSDGSFKSYVLTTIDLVIDLAGYFSAT